MVAVQDSDVDINVMLNYHIRSLWTPPSTAAKLLNCLVGSVDTSDTFFSPKVGLSGNVNSCRLHGTDAKLRSLVAMDQLEYFNPALIADTAIWSAPPQNMTERQATHSKSGNVES